MEALSEGGSSAVANIRPFAETICKQKWVKPNRRIFDNKKVSDHFAIIPTLQVPRELSEAEGKIYYLITRRFLAVFFPAAEFRITTRITEVRSEGRRVGKACVSTCRPRSSPNP